MVDMVAMVAMAAMVDMVDMVDMVVTIDHTHMLATVTITEVTKPVAHFRFLLQSIPLAK